MSSKTKTTAMQEEAKPVLVPKLRFPEFQGTEGWDVKSLGAVCQPQQWATISSTDLVDEGYPVYGANGFIGHYSDFNHEFETVAVTCRGSTCGEVSLIPPKSYITGNSMCLDGIDAARNSYHFLFQLLRHRGFKDVISGSAQPQIVGNAIKRLKITLPANPEQQKIAECLSSVDELIVAQARKVDALKTHKKGLMQQLFTSEGETHPRLRFPEFQNAGEWVEKPLSALIDLISGMHLSPENYSTSGEVPYFTGPSDFTNDLQTVTKWTKRTANVSQADDTLITVKGSGVGEIWYSTLPVVALGRQLMAIRSKNGSSRFIFQFLLTKRSRFEDLGSGNLIPGLSRAVILELKACFPSPAEQQSIASCLTSLDDLIAAQTRKHEALKTHKKGLMQQLFLSPEQRTTS